MAGCRVSCHHLRAFFFPFGGLGAVGVLSRVDVLDMLGDGGAVDCKKASSRSKLSSQTWRYKAIQLATSCSGAASRRHGRVCAARPREIRPARSSTFRCLEMDGCVMA